MQNYFDEIKNIIKGCINKTDNVSSLIPYLGRKNLMNSDLLYLVDNLDSLNLKEIPIDQQDLFFRRLVRNIGTTMKLDLFEKIIDLYESGKISKEITLNTLGAELSVRKSETILPFVLEDFVDKNGEFRKFLIDSGSSDIYKLFEDKELVSRECILEYLKSEASSFDNEIFYHNLGNPNIPTIDKRPIIDFSIFVEEYEIKKVLEDTYLDKDSLIYFISNLDDDLATVRAFNHFIYKNNENSNSLNELFNIVLEHNPNLFSIVTCNYFTPEQIDKAISLENPMIAKQIISSNSFKELPEDKQQEYIIDIVNFSTNDDNWNKYDFDNNAHLSIAKSNLASSLAKHLGLEINSVLNGQQALEEIKEIVNTNNDFSK